MEVTLNLPENIYQNFTRLAEKKQRRVEEVISDKLQADFSSANVDIEETISNWSNEDVFALARLKLPEVQANRMSELSDLQQRGMMSNLEKNELGMYLEIYNQANLRKAQGILEATRRGLIKTLSDLK